MVVHFAVKALANPQDCVSFAIEGIGMSAGVKYKQ